jgi:ABC-type sugar transport system substrate-binding protein
MRRALVLALLVLTALVPAASAGPSLALQPTKATFLAVDRSLWVRVAWTPPTRSTNVTVVVLQGTRTVKTFQAKHWLVGTKTFELALPRSIPNGSTLHLKVRASSSAGSDQSALDVVLS